MLGVTWKSVGPIAGVALRNWMESAAGLAMRDIETSDTLMVGFVAEYDGPHTPERSTVSWPGPPTHPFGTKRRLRSLVSADAGNVASSTAKTVGPPPSPAVPASASLAA